MTFISAATRQHTDCVFTGSIILSKLQGVSDSAFVYKSEGSEKACPEVSPYQSPCLTEYAILYSLALPVKPYPTHSYP